MWCALCKQDATFRPLPLCDAEPNLRDPVLKLVSSRMTKFLCSSENCSGCLYGCNQTCQIVQGRKRPQKCIFNTRKNFSRHIKTLHSEELKVLLHGPTRRVTPPASTQDAGVHLPVSHRFVSDSLHHYRDHCTRYGYSKAAALLVVQAAFQKRDAGFEGVPGPWVIAFLVIARIVLITGEEVHKLLSVLLQFLHGIVRRFLIPIGLFPQMPLPITTQQFQSMILNNTNTNSLKSILPVPHIKYNQETEHSFCSLTELIPLTMFLPPESCLKGDGICDRYRSTIKSESFFEARNRIPQIYRLLEKNTPTVLVYVTLWSDGWDPNRSNKSNRYPVWTATGTLIFVDLKLEDDPYMANTVLLGAGPGKESHEEFFQLLLNTKEKDWEDRNGMLRPMSSFSRHHKQNVNVFIALGPALQDNPERRGCAELLGGNSKAHGIFGVSCDFEKIERPFVACEQCQQHLSAYLKEGAFMLHCMRNCTDCYCFSIDKLCSEGKYTSRLLPSGLSLHPGDHGYEYTLGPRRLTFDDNIKAWDFAIQKFIIEETWSPVQARAYLKLFCCNDELQKRFVKDARLYMNIQASMLPGAEERYEPTELAEYRTLYQTPKNCLPKHPAIWSLFNIVDLTELPMHLQMGSIKAVLKTILKSTSCKDRQQDFIRRCNEILKTVQLLRVDISPVHKFKDDKFGGYVAENYSAIAMIFPWLSHVLEERIMQLSEICAAPDPLLKDWSTWSGRECKAWLMEHGISGLSKMTAEELKAEVKPYMTGENRLPIPDVVNNPGRDLPYSVMRKFLLYTNLLFGTIMLSDLDGFQARNRAQALVSLFLSSYDMIDQALIPSRSLPIWIAKYNMLGLLRVPEHFERHRHFRNQYEGGLLGEAMVKDLRNICPNAVRQNWSKNMVQKFYRNQALDAICNEACVAGTPVSMTKFCTGDFWQFFVLPTGKHSEATLTEKIQRNFRRYKSISDVQSSIEAGWPLSVIVYRVRNTLCFALVLSRGEKLYLRFIKLDRTKPTYEDTHGYIYFTIEVDPNSTEVSKNEWPNCGAFRFQSTALMLPDLWHHDRTNQQYKYTFVNDDWRRLDNNLNWTVKI